MIKTAQTALPGKQKIDRHDSGFLLVRYGAAR
jgi:hypothetical protein